MTDRTRTKIKKKVRTRRKPQYKTKLFHLLRERKISNRELLAMIQKAYGHTYSDCFISLVISGKKKNYYLATAQEIATVLGVSLDEVVGDVSK